MKLTILGSSPSFPNPGNASSGYLVSNSETTILLETGHGIASVLPTVIDPRLISAIVISHMHPDHYLDLFPLNYAYRFHYRRSKVPLLLPPGGMKTLNELFEPLEVDPEHFLGVFDVQEYWPEQGLRIDGISVAFAHTEHFIPAYAMRFESRQSDGEIGYSSDTGYAPDVVKLLRGVELALIEATYLESVAGQNGHLTAACAGQIAREADVKRLVLTHFEESLGKRLAAEASEAWGHRAELAEQLNSYEV